MNTSRSTKLLSFSALLFSALMFIASSANAAKVAGVTLAETLTVADQSLNLNGAGIRKKLFIKLYVGSLYTASGSGAASDIVNADEAMAIRLNMLSDLLTRKKMVDALNDGFKNPLVVIPLVFNQESIN